MDKYKDLSSTNLTDSLYRQNYVYNKGLIIGQLGDTSNKNIANPNNLFTGKFKHHKQRTWQNEQIKTDSIIR